jgi:hypothetical protein
MHSRSPRTYNQQPDLTPRHTPSSIQHLPDFPRRSHNQMHSLLPHLRNLRLQITRPNRTSRKSRSHPQWPTHIPYEFMRLRSLVYRGGDDNHERTFVWCGGGVGKERKAELYCGNNATRGQHEQKRKVRRRAYYEIIRSCVGGAWAIISEPFNMKGRTLAWILLGGPILVELRQHIALRLVHVDWFLRAGCWVRSFDHLFERRWPSRLALYKRQLDRSPKTRVDVAATLMQ